MKRHQVKVGMIVVSNGVRGQVCNVYEDADVVCVIAFPQDVGGLDGLKYQKWNIKDIHTTIERLARGRNSVRFEIKDQHFPNASQEQVQDLQAYLTACVAKWCKQNGCAGSSGGINLYAAVQEAVELVWMGEPVRGSNVVPIRQHDCIVDD